MSVQFVRCGCGCGCDAKVIITPAPREFVRKTWLRNELRARGWDLYQNDEPMCPDCIVEQEEMAHLGESPDWGDGELP